MKSYLDFGRMSAVALVLVAVPGARAIADDWAQWRGPGKDGISTETEWDSEGREQSVWSAEVGMGYSSVTVVDGKLFTMGYDKDMEFDVVRCLDAVTGEELWAHAYPSKIWNQYHTGGTLTTPSVDGDRVYTLNREAQFYCLEVETGEVLWDRALMEEFKGLETPIWGFSASPLILEETIILNLGRVIALDKKTGKLLWESEDYGHAYGTPLAIDVDGDARLAVFNGKGLAILSLKDGSAHGMHEWKTEWDVNAATPVLVGDDQLFISSGYNKGCGLVKVTAEGLEVVWENKSMRSHMSGVVLWEDNFYGFDEKNLTCLGMDGEKRWSVRDYDNGAVMVADGRLLIVSSKGELIVAEASPEEYTEISKAEVFEAKDKVVYWTTPVLVDGRVYCRSSMGDLVCRDHRKIGG
ncbi:MAG: outer membrane protein assembly factor BamB [Chlamydiales bacterium]|jgi:outer membrane protein assembly factor BamB